MEDEPMFDKGKVDLGIHLVCGQFDKLGLTLMERWYVSKCVEAAAGKMLGENLVELAEKWDREEAAQ